MTANVRYPAGDLTPAGWFHLINDDRPMMWLDAFDESIRIDIMGGLAPPYNDPMLPEAVAIKGLKGLIPPWKHIDQKGATEDGVTQINALNDPVEVEAILECIGRDSKHLRRVYRDLIGSIDSKLESQLNWLTHDMGHWWAPIRWFQGAPPDPMLGPPFTRQIASLRLRADNGFWRTYDDNALFQFDYASMVDEFTTDYSGDHDLGPNWPQRYVGTAAGYCTAVAGEAKWIESGNHDRDVVNGPYKDFETETTNQVVEITLGSIPEFTFLGGCFNDIWLRMNRNIDGTWAGDGIRARIGLEGLLGWIQIDRFKDFVGTPLTGRSMIIPPLFGEKFRGVAGQPGDPRLISITRNGLPILSYKETGNDMLPLDDYHKGVGFGMHAGSTVLFSQKSPAWVSRIAAGDNATVSQSGFLKRTNIGDQVMFDDIQFFGPGTVTVSDGPGSDDSVTFGPLLPNQVAMLRTDPRHRGVEDLTSVPPTPQQLTIFQQALEQFESFAFGQNVPPLLQTVNSLFGIAPPQGNFYSLLQGRFSDNYGIPAKSPGNPAQPYYVKVEIAGGNADSKVLASGTPLRRYPL